MEPNEKLSPDNQSSKHFLSLHISHKGNQKAFHLKKEHTLAICVAACVFIGGSAVTLGSYFHTKNELLASQQELMEAERTNRKLEQTSEVLQDEHTEYTQNIDSLQEKAAELEQKINELEDVKNSLNDQLNHISANDNASAEIYNAVASCFVEAKPAAANFTPIVTTSFNKVTSLGVQLDRIDSRINQTGLSFSVVATDVTETLSAYSNIPSGLPVNGMLSSLFNPNGLSSISDGRVHYGVDISTRSRILPIVATAAGTVIEADYHCAYGNYVLIDHGSGFVTRYAHNTENLVSPGDVVKKGDVIATTGATGQSTGIHCHYEVILNGVFQDPMDYQ
ncbi:murein DD-endopeptidase MepM [Anaerotignum neopropionicum]|uniref:Murein DD-endopeptidase MepM n=1 Tax=Anaerotignum neopropionicum TaxID=36847 RepID=A0A136WJ66_9FIRM|nr:M23 family metallopeptidase [Anaerotignum neopropionicum]KXL54527.1 murein DD-endopeptidase MepM [Anaerotignum neopropionicum]